MMMPCFWVRKRSGFTLIELLVVISIGLILAALTVPGVARMLEEAESVKSQNNLRQIGVALLSFAQDNDGSLPRAGGAVPFDPFDDGSPNAAWMSRIFPYLDRNADVLGSKHVARRNVNAATYSYFLGSHAAGHAQEQDEGAFNALTCPPVLLTRIRERSKHIMAGEAMFGFLSNDADKDDYGRNNPAFKGASNGLKSRILFADGHIESAERFDPTRMAVTYDGITDPPYAGYH